MKLDERTMELLDSFYIMGTKDENNTKEWTVQSAFQRNGAPVLKLTAKSLSSILAPFGITHDEDVKFIEDFYCNRSDIRLKKDETGEFRINGYLSWEDFVEASINLKKENDRNLNL